ncbi:hypothetical protein C343_00600 [Cryptococcus neoformans C23]|uniref:Uncharacterized protein n=2 Tax=Cryptococcus neoformans TaxID=5207 RepID=A0A854QJY8_CRYNE|nr:hypothetical protein CNAG_00586 [Cryptococcus neoformans var. grubii H99]AUB22178.1 hypothetical protein CKF44_00586 [Cryptococcus neoformans var. grubii]OWZ36503.1 hypothetical protein C347_00676 [Cryptococcus neoformans var. grubii AD2-60a]OWZ48172.1 hypothetical protein C343_00600 [Cryptococcus neoformans var. grubii C23]OWZ56736.1 hypothetical protein C353_00606 [Cryptococcus neoformans var. grubii AD1-83a]OWZ57941.1 hypothetical protein C368_01113 [Cryptococcus neoformans var. grubii 1|eukprot:XP_012046821.1 hypothetical protein CNAG_00586 [Cryptococcus neoformans var. grubii H99]
MFTPNVFAHFTVLLSITGLVSAVDYRLLVNKPSCQTMDQFRYNFETLCPVFAISNTSKYEGGLYFYSGDYQGQNAETQARVFCTYVNTTDNSVYPVTSELVTSLGGSTA